MTSRILGHPRMVEFLLSSCQDEHVVKSRNINLIYEFSLKYRNFRNKETFRTKKLRENLVRGALESSFQHMSVCLVVKFGYPVSRPLKIKQDFRALA